MGFLAKRRLRKAMAEHEAFLDSCELLSEWQVRFDLHEARVSVFAAYADGLTDAEREWLDTFVAVGYIVKMAYNLVPRGHDLWPDVLTGKALSPASFEDTLTLTGRREPGIVGFEPEEPVSEPTHVYLARVYREGAGMTPFLQTPYEPADGREDVLAPWSLGALLTVLRSAQDREGRRPIDRAVELLEEHRSDGDWDMTQLTHIELVVMAELAAENLVPEGLLPVELVDHRHAVMAAAIERLESEIAQSPVDDYFVLMLLACARGGYQALKVFANVDLTDVPDRVQQLVKALESEQQAETCVRAAAWLMTARILAMDWPDRYEEPLEVARSAMPADDHDMRRLSEFAALTAEAASEDARASAMMKLTRRSMEWIAEKALGTTEDIYHIPALMSWGECWAYGVEAFRDRLDELEANNPDIRPEVS